MLIPDADIEKEIKAKTKEERRGKKEKERERKITHFCTFFFVGGHHIPNPGILWWRVTFLVSTFLQTDKSNIYVQKLPGTF